MQIDTVITLANVRTRMEFLAMERSLRGTGSTVPVLVIPYDDHRFELPTGSSWWEVPEILNLVAGAHPMFRKYQCLSIRNYQFVDTDCVFLRDPNQALSSVSGFVTCCGHWRDSTHTTTERTRELLSAMSTLWQRHVFNAGQFACDTALYTADDLAKLVTSAVDLRTPDFHDQPAMNLLVIQSGIAMTNLTLPPYYLESSWAGDYTGDFSRYWTATEKAPYMIHWAGLQIDGTRPIDELFLRHLSEQERAEYLRPARKRLFGLFGGV